MTQITTEQDRRPRPTEHPLDGIDWSAEFTSLDDPDPELPITEDLWLSALHQDGQDFKDAVYSSYSTYHTRIGRLDSLIAFDFSVDTDDEDRLVATGNIHPATKSIRGDYYTDFDQKIASRRFEIKMKDPAANIAIRRALRGE